MDPFTFDADGRLHCAAIPISKAAVNPYRWRDVLMAADEIEGGETIDPDEVVYLWRPGSELAKAAPTFQNLPLTSRHIAGLDELNDVIVGATGSKCWFSDPYLCCDCTVWAQSSIDHIAAGTRAAPSIGYSYSVEMTPGVTPSGEHYDGRMRDISGHHIALVGRSRCGPEVSIAPRAVAADVLPFEFEGATS